MAPFFHLPAAPLKSIVEVRSASTGTALYDLMTPGVLKNGDAEDAKKATDIELRPKCACSKPLEPNQ